MSDQAPETIEFEKPADKSDAEHIAALRLSPFMRHATTANASAAELVRYDHGPVSALTVGAALQEAAEKVAAGDVSSVSNMLLSQSVTLDVIMTEMIARAQVNRRDYPDAFQRYMNLALKAQAQSRATLEAVAKIHQPREQVVRHVHVYEGGQAVVAEQLHMHGPGVRDAGRAEQSQAARAGDPSERPALSSPDPLGNGVPVPGREGEAQMSHARRDKPRRAPRQQQRAEARPTDS